MKKALVVLSLSSLLSGCASVVPKGQTPDPDPFQYTNRKIFAFNQQVDKIILKPVAQGYRAVTPAGVRQSVRNFYGNIREIPNTVNEVLQLSPQGACRDFVRFGMNSTLGIFGLFDVAGHLGLKKKDNSFGNTLSYWGMKYSPYIVLPIIGPSTVRDAAGTFVDNYYNPITDNWNHNWLNAYYALNGIMLRESFLDTDDVRRVMSFDEYVFVRNAYLQRHGMVVPDMGNAAQDDF